MTLYSLIVQNIFIRETYLLSFTGTEHNFQKFGWHVAQSLGVAYDTGKNANFTLC